MRLRKPMTSQLKVSAYVSLSPSECSCLITRPVTVRFDQAKKISKQKLAISKEKLAEADDDLRDEFTQMEQVRLSRS